MKKDRYAKPPFRGQKGRCCWCGSSPLPKGRQSWCSDRCVNDYLLVSSPSHIRKAVYRRDKGICAICGVNATKEYRKWQAIAKEVNWLANRLINTSRNNVDFVNGNQVLRDTKFPSSKESRQFIRYMLAKYAPANWTPGRSTGWDADHIVPVVEGGGQCDLSNFRTLCHPCHKAETAKLATRLAECRKSDKQPN